MWKYDYTSGAWSQLSTANPVFMVAGDLFGDGCRTGAVVDFGASYGLWIFDGNDGDFGTSFWWASAFLPDHNVGF